MKEYKPKCDLKSCFLCRSCLKEWHPAIDKHRKNYKVKKGEVIFREGDPVTGIYFIYQGSFKVHKQWGPDKELIVRFARNGAILGHRGLGSNPNFPVSATALEPSVVCFIDINFFESTLKVNNEFTYQLMLFFADELHESEQKMRNMAHMPVKGRLAKTLLKMKEVFGTTSEGIIDISISRQDIASHAGATYESVFRNLNELIHHRVISVSGKGITILNEEALAALGSEEYSQPKKKTELPILMEERL